MLQVLASPTIVILMTLEVSFMLLANIYSRGVTHDDHHVTIMIYLKYKPQDRLVASAYRILRLKWVPLKDTLAYFSTVYKALNNFFSNLEPWGLYYKTFYGRSRSLP
jgi:hypothetical protein